MDNRPYNEKAVEIFKEYLPANIAELAIEAHKKSVQHRKMWLTIDNKEYTLKGCLESCIAHGSVIGTFSFYYLEHHVQGNTITATEEQLREWFPEAYLAQGNEDKGVTGDEPNELPEVEAHHMAELAAASNAEDTRDTTLIDALRRHKSARLKINRSLYSFYENYVNEKDVYWADMLYDSGDGNPRLYTFEEFVSLPRVIQLLVMKINEKRRIESVDNFIALQRKLDEIKNKLSNETMHAAVARSNYKHVEDKLAELNKQLISKYFAIGFSILPVCLWLLFIALAIYYINTI